MERQVLDSWKEISAYLGRSEVTCRRLEQELGLPVHRLEDSPKARVYAYKDEIDLWIEKTQHSEKKILLRKSHLKKRIIPAFVVIVIAIVAVVLWQLLSPKSTISPSPQNLSIAVISFENKTDDKSYDYLTDVIPNLLITNLEQSGYFQVTSWERLHDLLRQMGKVDVEVIDRDLGFELCQLNDVDAIVMGSYTKAGEMFVTDVKALDVETKRILSSASSRGKGAESILQSQIDELSKEISRGISISKTQSRKTPIRITDVTTNSLDAYSFFIRGYEYLIFGKYKDAQKYLEKALELDPNFAVAHFHYGLLLRFLGDEGAANNAFRKAKKFSARASEKERLYIEGVYARRIDNNVEESFRIFKDLVQKYPEDKRFRQQLSVYFFRKGLFNQAIEELNRALELDPYDVINIHTLASYYWSLGNYEKAIEYFEKEIPISPAYTDTHLKMALVYFEMGKVDEALAKIKEAIEAGVEIGHRAYQWKISYILAFKEDYLEALRWIDRYIDTTPRAKGWENLVKSLYLYWTGRLDKSMSNLLSQINSADEMGIVQRKANACWMMGWISLDRNEFELCRKHFKCWFDIYMQDVLPKWENPAAIKKHWTAWYYFYLGLVDLKQGEIESAKSRLMEMNSLLSDVLPEFKKWINFYYYNLQAEVLLAEGAVDKAIKVSEKSPPLGGPVRIYHELLHNVPFLKDTLARAYRENGEIEKAIAEYKRLTTFDPKREERYLIHPKYYYRLAELYEQQGNRAKAIEHYEKFLDLWKDADPGIAEVEDARERLDGLKGENPFQQSSDHSQKQEKSTSPPPSA